MILFIEMNTLLKQWYINYFPGSENKLWLIKMLNYSSFQPFEGENHQYKKKIFSITCTIGRGKCRENVDFFAEHNTATGIYTFRGQRFCTQDEMLDYILFW
jgi:hypothetical protein